MQNYQKDKIAGVSHGFSLHERDSELVLSSLLNFVQNHVFSLDCFDNVTSFVTKNHNFPYGNPTTGASLSVKKVLLRSNL